MDKQKNILNQLENTLRDTGFLDEEIYSMLTLFHNSIMIITTLMIVFGSKKMYFMALTINIIIFLLFNLFNGCILTRLEKRFCNDNFTVIDPFLEYFNFPVTFENRVKASKTSAIICFIFTAIVYFVRFGEDV